jgi:hypothetical protein
MGPLCSGRPTPAHTRHRALARTTRSASLTFLPLQHLHRLFSTRGPASLKPCRSSFRTRSTPVRLRRAVSAQAGAVRANSAAVVARALCSRAPFPPVPPSSCSTPAQPAPLQCLPPPAPLHIHALPRRRSAAAWPSLARAPGLAASASHSSTRFCSASAPPKPRAPTAASL